MKKLAYIGCLGVIGIITTEFGIIGILPQVAAHYHITIDKAGVLLSAFALVIALTGPVVTLLTSGVDRKKLMLSSMGLFVLSTLGSVMAPPFWLLLLLRILPAFLQPVFISNAIAAAVAVAPPKQSHRMMAIIMGGISIATVTTVPLSTWLAGRFNWQTAFMMQAGVSIVAWLSIWLLLPPMPLKEKKSYGDQLMILKRGDFLLTSFINFMMIAAWFSTYSYFADYLGQEKRMSGTMISSMMLLFGITGVAGNWLTGKVIGRHMVTVTLLLLSGTIIIPFGLAWCGYEGAAVTGVIALWGLLYAPSILAGAVNMISSAPDALEFANSLSVSTGNLGVSVGTAVSGMVIATHSVAYAPWVGMVFGVVAIMAVLLRAFLRTRTSAPACVAQ
ncbi:MFS transporter [Chitinophaga varians]|uniref:MFS transporter n=1 Tax=Chitinophaga varians TaxID=2202339 RepID=A0A847RZ10_9BACT|nr:MFS transporter [Chitinophaga varians]NLR65887.1 MFS transporter [Chitinophaga varians]